MLEDFDIPRIAGINRTRETTDKPNKFPDYVRDMRQNQDGVWERRPAIGHVYPDRGNQYEFTTPRGERTLNGLPTNLVTLPLYEHYYNSHRRKTIIKLINPADGQHWLFYGVIRDHNMSDQQQWLEIWRCKLEADNVTEMPDPDYATHATFAHIQDECYGVLAVGDNYAGRSPHNKTGSFIQYSMVAGNDSESIYIAIVLRKSNAETKTLYVVKLTDLFEDEWGGNSDYPTWTGVGDAGTGVDGKIVETADVGGLTMTVDLDIDLNGRLHLLYGFLDTVDESDVWKMIYDNWGSDLDGYSNEWGIKNGDEDEISEGTDSIYGGVLKVNVNTIYVGYMRMVSDDAYDIARLTWAVGSSPTGSGELIDTAQFREDVAGLEDFFGPAINIDTDGAVYWTFLDRVLHRIVMKKEGGDLVLACRTAFLSLFTNWAVVIKDGVAIVYYGDYRVGSGRLIYPDYVVRRVACIFDSDDSEYTDGAFFNPDLVEEAEIFQHRVVDDDPDYHETGQYKSTKGEIVTWLQSYDKYESDNPKRISLTTLAPSVGRAYFGGNPDYQGVLQAVDFGSFKRIRQDRGVFEGESEVTMQQPHRYDALELSGDQYELVRLNIIQTEQQEGLAVDPFFAIGTVHRFYERRDWQWMLLKGQMDEGNNNIIRRTAVADPHCSFTDKHHVLRAGCGIASESNRAIWYGFRDAYFFRHSNFALPVWGSLSANLLRLRDRRMLLSQRVSEEARLYPRIADFAISEIAEIGIEGIHGEGGGDTHLRRIYANLGALGTTLDSLEPESTGGAGETEDDGEAVDYHYQRCCPLAWKLRYHDSPGSRSYDNGGITIEPEHPPLTHPWRTLDDVDDFINPNYSGLGTLPSELRKLPYREIFLGFSYRFYNGAHSPIVIQSRNEPYHLGLVLYDWTWNDVDAGSNFTGDFISMLKIVIQQNRWDEDGGIDPRVEAIEVHVGDKLLANQDRFNVVYRKAGEVLVSKREQFKGEAWNGDAEWDTTDGRQFEFTFYLDYKKLVTAFGAADDVDLLGFSPPVLRRTNESPFLTGYKHLRYINDRQFFLAYRMNDKSNPDKMTWAGQSVAGNELLLTEDMASPARYRPFPFNVQNGRELGEGNLAIVGDNDIEVGRLVGNELDWRVEGTRQDIGTDAADSVASVSERSEGGGLDGIFFLSNKDSDNNDESGGRIFDLFSSKPITNEMLKDFVSGTNPAGTRIVTTLEGIESMNASNAMAIHLPLQRLLMINFPTSNLIAVRDFKAEDMMKEGKQWMIWRFGKTPVAWCLAPEGYLIFTDGEYLWRFPDAEGASTDAGTAISNKMLLGSVRNGARNRAQINEIALDYECTGTTAKVSVVRDDGKIQDSVYTFPSTTIGLGGHSLRRKVIRRLKYAMPFERMFALWIEPTDPASCTKFKIYGIAGMRDIWRSP